MCESLPIAHLSLFIATPHSESTQAQPAKGKTGQERETEEDRGERDGEGKRKGIEGGIGEEAGRERGDVRRGG